MKTYTGLHGVRVPMGLQPVEMRTHSQTALLGDQLLSDGRDLSWLPA